MDRCDLPNSSGSSARSKPTRSGTCSPGPRPPGETWASRLQPERRPGYDLTFSAPKGVSLALGVRDRVRSVTRSPPPTTGPSAPCSTTCPPRPATPVGATAGGSSIEANGFIGAAFRHRTSRAGDPQLHTHVVVPNLVQGADGRWSAPDGRHLFTWKMTAGTLYQSALRAELAPLGLAWDIRRNGLSELRDIPKAILRAFSKRRVDIEAAMEQRGSRLAVAAAETAALATRASQAR